MQETLKQRCAAANDLKWRFYGSSCPEWREDKGGLPWRERRRRKKPIAWADRLRKTQREIKR
jgi:hypothetical protein